MEEGPGEGDMTLGFPSLFMYHASLGKDSDKLFRLCAFGFRVDCERFEVNLQTYWPHLLKRKEEWFLTRTGKELADREVREREREMQAKLEH
jgi:hypothetical protein